jgi:hypothetical protein
MKTLSIASASEEIFLIRTDAATLYKQVSVSETFAKEDSITTTIDLVLKSPDPASISMSVENLARLLSPLMDRQAVPRLFNTYLRQVDVEGETWESELDNAQMAIIAGEREKGWLHLRLALTRCRGWLGAERELPLSNRNGVRVTGGLAIYNHTDGDAGHDNFIDISPIDVAGDLPAILHLEALNTTLSAEPGGDLLVGCCLASGGAYPPHVLEAEEASGGSMGADETCSAGGFAALDWSSGEETDLLEWPLDSALVSAAGGRWFRPVARFRVPPSCEDLWLGVKIAYGAQMQAVKAWSPALCMAGRQLADLPAMQIPPCLPGLSGLEGAALRLYARRNQTGSHHLEIDCLYLLPLDSWRRYESCGGLAANWRLVDDGETVYALTDSYGKVAAYAASGVALQVTPGTGRRLVFLQSSGTLAPIERSLRVQAFYRPCRLSP